MNKKLIDTAFKLGLRMGVEVSKKYKRSERSEQLEGLKYKQKLYKMLDDLKEKASEK